MAGGISGESNHCRPSTITEKGREGDRRKAEREKGNNRGKSPGNNRYSISLAENGKNEGVTVALSLRSKTNQTLLGQRVRCSGGLTQRYTCLSGEGEDFSKFFLHKAVAEKKKEPVRGLERRNA